jgi:hypothetical protein
MKAEIVELETSVHQKVQKLLSFSGRLSSAEQDLVDRHLDACAQCREEIEWESRVKAIPPEAGAAPDMEAALARLLPRVATRPRRRTNWMPWALAAQLLVIAGLGVGLFRQDDGYRLLGAAAAPAPEANLVVMFRDGASERQVQAVLRAQGARVVGGPTDANAWLVRAPAKNIEQVAAELRSDPAVELAEPLAPGALP